MTQEEQHERLTAYANGNLLANCEECGKPIPVELSKCTECAWDAEGKDPEWCYTCDRPKNDCGCVENGGTY